jgi:large subunit ribosomal protein L25
MASETLNSLFREQTGKEIAKKLRMEGNIPAVLYGHSGTKALSVKALEFENLFEIIGEHSIITLNIDGKENVEVIVKDFQLDPVKKKIIHVDFFEIEKGKLLKTGIPVKAIGTAIGVKKGGILELFIRDIEIECLPKDIPEGIVLNIENLDVGDSLHVKDVHVSEKIKLLANPEQVILTIGTPTKITAPVEEVEEVPEAEEAPPVEEKKEEEA